LATRDASGATIVTALPITRSVPKDGSEAVEIPQIVKRRLGLDEARSV
jgi:hypothetical protein